jgi:hypothetical protein
MFTVSDLVLSATEVAVMMAVWAAAVAAGAVKVAEDVAWLEREPTLVLHVTPALLESLVTVAVTVVVSVASTVVEAAETETLLGAFAHPERNMRAREAVATRLARALSLNGERTLLFRNMDILRNMNRTVRERLIRAGAQAVCSAFPF